MFFIFYLQIKLFLQFVVDEFVFLADSPLHIALHLSRGGEIIVECYIFSAYYIEKFWGIIVFGKFSCNTYVIVVLNCDTVVFLNMRNFLWLARRLLVWLCQFLDSSLRCYGVRYTPNGSSTFFGGHALTSATRPALIVWYCAQLRF